MKIFSLTLQKYRLTAFLKYPKNNNQSDVVARQITLENMLLYCKEIITTKHDTQILLFFRDWFGCHRLRRLNS